MKHSHYPVSALCFLAAICLQAEGVGKTEPPPGAQVPQTLVWQDAGIDAQAIEADWVSSNRLRERKEQPDPGATAKILERGIKLADHLHSMGLDVTSDVQEMRAIGERQKACKPDETNELNTLYFKACWAVRRLALRNPLLDFDAILFTKGAPTRFPHLCDQYYGWWSRPGGGLYILKNFRQDTPRLACLTAGWAPGSFIHPDLSYDGKKILFSYCRWYPDVPPNRNKTDTAKIPEDAFYHVFEMNIDGSGLRQLTHGRYDDFDARYLPSDDIVFVSTRKGLALQCGKAGAEATLSADLPYSYVRCGGDTYRPVPVFTLHRMDATGKEMWPMSAFENFEWTPSVANDGRILYTRWDYIDRFNGHFFSLWSTNPDGTNPQLVYGNYTRRPQAVMEARSIPMSSKLVFTASAHHSISGGSLVLFDRTRGIEEEAPLTRLTPEVAFPETEGWGNSYYVNPWPLSEDHYLTAWSNCRLPPHGRFDSPPKNPTNATGIYLYDSFGNLTLLYRDPDISSAAPIPVKSRVRPPVIADNVEWDGPQEGCFMLQDVYQGLDGVPRGSIERLRIVAVPPKVQPFMNSPSLGVSREENGKFLLGTVPVEEDGSAFFRVPSGIPVFFQAVGPDGMATQTMRSLTYVWPGQTLGCVGCHESREAAPAGSSARAIALTRQPSKITPGPEGSWPLRFDTLVQPVLDKNCIACHQPGSPNPKAAAFNLTPAKAWPNLIAYGRNDLRTLAFEKDRSIVGQCVARNSKLTALLTSEPAHGKVRLDRGSLDRLFTWMDLYAPTQGHFSDKQEQEIRELKKTLEDLLEK